MNTSAVRLATLVAACTLLNGCRGGNANVPPVPTPATSTAAPPASAVLPALKSNVGPGSGPAGHVVPASQAESNATVGSASPSSGLVSGPAALKAVPCSVNEVTLKPGASDGTFDGMSHSGTYLIVTNRSHSACSIPGMPSLTFTDENGPVATIADLPGAKFMHPGPVVLPILLQPKQSVYATARWVDGPVFSTNVCYKLTGVGVAMMHDGAVVMPIAGQMCGDKSKGVHYELQRYTAGTPAKK